MLIWIVAYALAALVFKWILSWGGAAVVEGWVAGISLGWWASDWNEEQIRLYALCAWVVTTIVFVVGLFVPELRMLGGLFAFLH